MKKILIGLLLLSLSSALFAKTVSNYEIQKLITKSLSRSVPAFVTGRLGFVGNSCNKGRTSKVKLLKIGKKRKSGFLVKVRVWGYCTTGGDGMAQFYGNANKKVKYNSKVPHEFYIYQDGYGDWTAKYKGIGN